MASWLWPDSRGGDSSRLIQEGPQPGPFTDGTPQGEPDGTDFSHGSQDSSSTHRHDQVSNNNTSGQHTATSSNTSKTNKMGINLLRSQSSFNGSSFGVDVKAVKMDNASIPVQLWNDRIRSRSFAEGVSD